MSSVFTLYAANTANGYKALIPLHEFGCDYDLHVLDLVKGEQFDSAFTRLSPVARVPVLNTNIDGNEVSIYGTEAIAIFLADHYQRFMPEDKIDRAKVIEMTSLVSSDLALPLAVQFQVDVIVAGNHPEVIEYFTAQARRILTALDSVLQDNAWLAGAEYSIADMLAFPSVAISAARIADALEGLDALLAWQEKVAARPAVNDAMAIPLG